MTNIQGKFFEWLGPIRSGAQNDIYQLCWIMMTLHIGNNTLISRVLIEQLRYKSDEMYTQKAFVHWFIAEGLEENDLEQAREELDSLNDNYYRILGDWLESEEDEE